MMKQAFLLFALLAAAPALGAWTPGHRVQFGIGLSGYFKSMPISVSEAKTARFEQVTPPDGPLPSLVLYCTSDYIYCIYFDDIEYIAGIQIGIPQDKFTNATWDWEARGFTSWTPTDSDTSFWTIQQYFVDETILATDADERLAAYDDSKTIQYGKVWLTGPGGDLLEVSTDEDEIADSIFTEQACIPLMGRHYYYNMTADTECTATAIYPWFPLAASGELVGMGLLTPGLLPEASLDTDYFERPSQSAVELIVTSGPQCLYDLAGDPGFLTMHIYYISNPLLLTCIFQ